MTAPSQRFDEKILYKTHQHWIVPTVHIGKYFFLITVPFGIVAYFISGYSLAWTFGIAIFLFLLIVSYTLFLWKNSWLFIGNQKVTLTVRNGIFSQYAMNIRYRNMRDSAVSKKSFWSFFLKYGTLYARSSANEGDFHAEFVPKVGKVYALINALSRYSDEERASIATIQDLHEHHNTKEATHTIKDTLDSHK